MSPLGSRACTLGITRTRVKNKIGWILETDHHRVARARRNGAVNLARRHEGTFTGLEQMKRIALTQVHLSLENEDRVIRGIVNVL